MLGMGFPGLVEVTGSGWGEGGDDGGERGRGRRCWREDIMLRSESVDCSSLVEGER